MRWQIGIDVGGTFTDFFALDAVSGEVRLHKRPSTPANPADAIVEGLKELCAAASIETAEISRISHGTTVATNALIQRRGGRVAVITTRGFRDLLEIGRQTRPHMYSLQEDHPAPLAPRRLRFEVDERITAGGRVLQPLDQDSLTEAVEAVKASAVDACAVCLLFSFENPAHEQAVRDAVAAAVPALSVCASSDVQPEFREVERFSTTVLNAYLQPVMRAYLASVSREVGAFAPRAPVRVYQSSGGLMSLDRAARLPIRTALSGPAAGVAGAIDVARRAGRPSVLTFDMGGTSTDVCLIRDYAAGIGFEREVAGFPIRLPMVNVHTVGAGGGSIAWFDKDDLLKVGPISAGAVPGPACYGLGGDGFTVTDANLFLGRLSPRGLAGGAMKLDERLSASAAQPLADRLGVSPRRAALGVVEIVVANMVRAIRAVSVEKGHDPRDYALMPFGGAGGLHACEIARALFIRDIVVPPAPGILCAQGLIVSDLKEDFVRTIRLSLTDESSGAIARAMAELESHAEAWFAEEGVALDRRRREFSFDMRYVGQNHELAVIAEPELRNGLAGQGVAELRNRFLDAHRRSYGHCDENGVVELVNVRLTAYGAIYDAPPPTEAPSGRRAKSSAVRPVCFADEVPVEAPIYERSSMPPGSKIVGPAVIEQLDSTTVLFPGDRLTVHESGALIIEVVQ